MVMQTPLASLGGVIKLSPSVCVCVWGGGGGGGGGGRFGRKLVVAEINPIRGGGGRRERGF